jgi:hypothetical protein
VTAPTCSDISGATNSIYIATSSDAGKRVRLRVTATNGDGSTSATSYSLVVAAASPVNETPPTISGTVDLGQTLTAGTGGWSGSGISYTYQWQRCDAGGTCTDIGGATAPTYVVVSADVGQRVRVKVTATNADGTAEAFSAMAGATSNVPVNASPPTVDGNATVGETLTGTAGAWSGAGAITYAYQWERCTTGGTCAAIWGWG